VAAILQHLDLSRPPTAKRRAALAVRRDRLKRLEEHDYVAKAIRSFKRASGGVGLAGPLRLRHGFAYLSDPASGGSASDRRLPPREQRPPATRLATSRGAALRFELTALALAQARRAPGGAVDNPLPLSPRRRDAKPLGWIDLIASDADISSDGRVSVSPNDKKLRQAHSALKRLYDAGLVDLPRRAEPKDVYENFVLLDERGSTARPDGPALDYRIPGPTEAVFGLPAAFVTRGWLHVLEDSEIALLMMVACGRGRNPGELDGSVAISGGTRLLHYGIGRDSFGAHVMLQKLGLLSVKELGRHDDGRAVDYNEDGESQLHRLKMLPAGFDSPALATLLAAVEYELDR
jgi:hypothetical protein